MLSSWHACRREYVDIYIYIYIHVCMCIYIYYKHIHRLPFVVCTHIYTCRLTHPHRCLSICICLCIYLHTHIYSYKHLHVYCHMHGYLHLYAYKRAHILNQVYTLISSYTYELMGLRTPTDSAGMRRDPRSGIRSPPTPPPTAQLQQQAEGFLTISPRLL